MLEEIFRLQCKEGEDVPSFKLEREDVERLCGLLMKHNRIQNPVSYERVKGGKK